MYYTWTSIFERERERETLCVHDVSQTTVDREICMMTTDMLHMLLKCFSELTAGGKKEKVNVMVRLGMLQKRK